MHTGGPKSAGNEKAAAKGPARYQDARGPSAGQVTPAVACPWAGAATCRGKRVVSTPSNQVAWHESGPLRCESNNSLPGRLSLQQKPTCPGTNEAQQPDHVSQTTTVTSCDGACVQITSAQSDLGEASMRSVGELSGRSECRVRTGAICLVWRGGRKSESRECSAECKSAAV